MHQGGEGNVEWNYEKAVYWFEKSAINGSYQAAGDLGDIYSKGLEKPKDGKKGIPQNHQEAVKWYLMAVNNGSESYFEELGLAYLEGKGVAENPKEAAKWLHKDSTRGSYVFDSQYLLANMYKDGNGIKESYYKCYIWISIAVEGVKNILINSQINPQKGERKLKKFTKTQKFCENELSIIEQKAGSELSRKYWDKRWNSKGSFHIPIEL